MTSRVVNRIGVDLNARQFTTYMTSIHAKKTQTYYFIYFDIFLLRFGVELPILGIVIDVVLLKSMQ